MIHAFSPLVTTPDELVGHVVNHEDVGIRRGMALVTGELIGPRKEQSGRSNTLLRDDQLTPLLLEIYRDDPDPGLHGAIFWTLVRFGKSDGLARADDELKSNSPTGTRRWYVNSTGHTMVVVPGWTTFVMGSDKDDPESADNEHQQSRQIRRSFCLSDHETTVAQFAMFQRATGGTWRGSAIEESANAMDRTGETVLLPQASVTWYEAAAYCNWLSSTEGIPADQWCYLPNENGEYEPGMQIADDFESRRGYRLPTEVEWEFACRAGTTTPRYFGNEPSWLGQYAVYSPSGSAGRTAGTPIETQRLRAIRHAGECCRMVPGCLSPHGFDRSRAATGDHSLSDDVARVVRGGSAAGPPAHLRSAARDKAKPGVRATTIGFRVARSNLQVIDSTSVRR